MPSHKAILPHSGNLVPLLGFVILILFFLLAGYATYSNISSVQSSFKDVTDTFTVIRQLDKLRLSITEAETGQRGFIITGNDRYLDAYNNGIANIKANLSIVDRAITSEEGRAILIALQTHITSKLAELDETIRIRREKGFDLARDTVLTDRGRQEMMSIQQLMQRLEEQAILLRRERMQFVAVAFTHSITTNFITTLLGTLLALAVAYFTLIGMRRRQKEAWIQQGLVEFSAVINTKRSIYGLGEDALNFLVRYLGATAGALYSRDNDQYVRNATYGISDLRSLPEFIRSGEGLAGEVIRDQKPIILDKLPQHYFHFSSALGRGQPAYLIITPAILGDIVKCVVELGFSEPPPPYVLRFLERASAPLAVAIKAALYRAELQNFAEETQRQSEEIQTQSEEVRAINEELMEQAESLKAAQRELETQHALLETRNTELAHANALINMKAKELEVSGQYKSDFLANMSHELRTPLNSTIILSRILSDNGEGNLSEEQVNFAKTIYAASQDLLWLINDILDLSKIESGHMLIIPETFELQGMVNNLRAMFEPLAKQKNLALGIHVDKDCPATLYHDQLRLQQILRNLISNAIKFTNEGSVRLDIRQRGRTIMFDVTDTGIGIAPDKQLEVFEAFHQADGTISRTYGGTGLGLTISKNLVQFMGGTLTLTSELGKGSIFTVTMPIAYEEPDHVPAPVQHPSVQPAFNFKQADSGTETHKRILVVEDDATQRSAISKALSDLTAQIDTAATLQEGLNLLTAHHYDLLILDLKLTDMSGDELFTSAQDMPTGKLPPVIIYTAMSMNMKTESALREHASAIIVKSDWSLQRLRDEARSLFNNPLADHALVRKTPYSSTTLAGKHVLIVEDDLRNIFALRSLLAPHNMQISIAHNGREALEFLDNHTPSDTPVSLVLMDVMMPEMDGYVATRKLRDNPRWKKLPIIMLTAKVMKGDQERCLQAGANDYLAKPIEPEKLIGLMRVWLTQ